MRNTWNKAVYKEIQVMDMEQIIREKLVEIENKENVRIIMAVESGSRAWDLLPRTVITMSGLYM